MISPYPKIQKHIENSSIRPLTSCSVRPLSYIEIELAKNHHNILQLYKISCYCIWAFCDPSTFFTLARRKPFFDAFHLFFLFPSAFSFIFRFIFFLLFSLLLRRPTLSFLVSMCKASFPVFLVLWRRSKL